MKFDRNSTTEKSPIRRLPSRGNTSPFDNFGHFFCCVPLGTLYPRLAIVDASAFSFPWRRLRGAAPVAHQDQGFLTVSLLRQTSAPGIVDAPENPQFPAVSKSCTTYRSYGSLTGPPFPGLTAEASHNSAIQRQALCQGLRPGRIRWGGCQPTFPRASSLHPASEQTSAKSFRRRKGHAVAHHVITSPCQLMSDSFPCHHRVIAALGQLALVKALSGRLKA
jgi:hypothetical protein